MKKKLLNVHKGVNDEEDDMCPKQASFLNSKQNKCGTQVYIKLYMSKSDITCNNYINLQSFFIKRKEPAKLITLF